MSTITPNYTDTGQSILSIQTLAKNAVVSGTLDLRSKYGAWIFGAYGRQGTTARTAGVAFLVRRMISAGTIEQPTIPIATGDAATASRTTCAASGNTANGTLNTITVASTTGFSAGDLIFIDDTGNAGLGSSEWARVNFVTSTTVLTLDRPIQNSHNSASAHVSNHADVFQPVYVRGGCFVEVIFDDGATSTGDTNACRVFYSTEDSYTVA